MQASQSWFCEAKLQVGKVHDLDGNGTLHNFLRMLCRHADTWRYSETALPPA